MKRFAVAFIILALAASSFAQPVPREQWAHTYGNELNDLLRDLFITEAGNFAMTGIKQMDEVNHGNGWLVLTNCDGRVIFDRNYGAEGETEDFWTLIEVEGGGYLMGGSRGTPLTFNALRVNANGDPIWWNNYGGNSNSRCYTIIELKAGEFVLAGSSRMFGDTLAGIRGQNGYVCKITPDGELIWQWAYGGPSSDVFHSMRETEDGILLVGSKGGEGWFCMIDDESGEFMWDRTYTRDDIIFNHYNVFHSLISCRDGGFFVAGLDAILQDDQNRSWQWVMRVNNEGERLWEQTYELHENGYARSFWSAQQMPDNGFAMVGSAARNGAQMLRIDRDGNPLWERLYPFPNQDRQAISSHILYTVLLTDRDELVACGYGRVADELGTGLLVKLRPERSAPMIVRQYPDTLNCTFLTGDTVLFDADVVDLQDDSILYQWRLEGEVFSTDTCTTVVFDQSGQFTLECWVSDGEMADSADWQISVRDLFISSYSPDTLSLFLRRGTTQTFSLDTVRAVEGDPVQYQWTLTNLDNFEGEETGTEASATVEFLRSGNYQMEGVAYRGESSDNVIWTVAVRGAVLDFWPRSLRLSVPPDSLVNFGVLPFNPESDSLSYAWYLDGELIGQDSTVGWWFAPKDSGQAGRSTYAVAAIVIDGMEGDTVRWEVTVQDPNATPPTPPSIEGGEVPATFGIVSVSPNPFNNSTTISFAVPFGSESAQSAKSAVRLTIHDLTGREVREYVSAEVQAGEHSYILNGADLPAGVYLIRLEVGEFHDIRKLVLLR